MPVFGVLALQGDFAAHAAALRDVGVPVREVRRARDVAGLAGLALPGGESSTLLNLMQDEPWFSALERLHENGGAFLGTCAGAILLAREVQPTQPSLGFLDASVMRNAYGRQVDSFQARVDAPALGEPLEAIFIRAPRLRELGPAVEVLARLGEEPVLVRQGRVLAATFHPELTRSRGLHRLFVEMATARATRTLEPTALLR
jgi:5'-phosphate synthase pdxT subunit